MDSARKLLVLLLPALAVPDLGAVGDARDRDVPVEPRVFPQVRRQEHPALLVRLRLSGSREEEPVEGGGFADGQLVQLCRELVPLVHRVDEEAVVEPARDDKTLAQLLAQLRGEVHPAFRVDAVGVLSCEHFITSLRACPPLGWRFLHF